MKSLSQSERLFPLFSLLSPLFSFFIFSFLFSSSSFLFSIFFFHFLLFFFLLSLFSLFSFLFCLSSFLSHLPPNSLLSRIPLHSPRLHHGLWPVEWASAAPKYRNEWVPLSSFRFPLSNPKPLFRKPTTRFPPEVQPGNDEKSETTGPLCVKCRNIYPLGTHYTVGMKHPLHCSFKNYRVYK